MPTIDLYIGTGTCRLILGDLQARLWHSDALARQVEGMQEYEQSSNLLFLQLRACGLPPPDDGCHVALSLIPSQTASHRE